jgi:predicted dehydrogenase
VVSFGGRRVLGETDNGETPDMQDALIEYPGGVTMQYSIREVSAGSRAGSMLEFFGTRGSLQISRGGFTVNSDMKTDPNNAIPQFKGQTAGGPQRRDVKPEPWTQAMKVPGSADEQLDLHVRNFLDCIKSRQRPVADAEEGHRTATTCHLANISLRTGRMLQWDSGKEQIDGDREASAMLERPYRKPWDGVLKSLLA